MKLLWIMLLVLTNIVYAKTVHSLDEIYPNIKHSSGKEYFAEEIYGTNPKDYLGRNFFTDPSELRKILAIIDPDLHDQEKWNFIGMKPWPSQPDTYIFIACINNNDKENRCHYIHNGKTVIAVLKYDQQNGFTLLAKPWIEYGQNTESSAFSLKSDNGEEVIGIPVRFDFAPYRLNADILAFGVRYIALVGYSGGGATDEAITLFAIIDNQLRPVFAAPTYHFANYAGNWHSDGTRDHEIHENVYIIKVLATSTAGMKDLEWSEKGAGKKKKSIRYKWNASNKKYTNFKP